jgi:hypothetical protein
VDPRQGTGGHPVEGVDLRAEATQQRQDGTGLGVAVDDGASAAAAG